MKPHYPEPCSGQYELCISRSLMGQLRALRTSQLQPHGDPAELGAPLPVGGGVYISEPFPHGYYEPLVGLTSCRAHGSRGQQLLTGMGMRMKRWAGRRVNSPGAVEAGLWLTFCAHGLLWFPREDRRLPWPEVCPTYLQWGEVRLSPIQPGVWKEGQEAEADCWCGLLGRGKQVTMQHRPTCPTAQRLLKSQNGRSQSPGGIQGLPAKG